VSHKGRTKGKPLSLVSINSIFGTLSKVLKFNVYPHLMRHKWNEIFEDKGLALGMTHQEINDLRKYACGWSEDTKMVSRYNQFKNALAAQKMSKIRQSKFMP